MVCLLALAGCGRERTPPSFLLLLTVDTLRADRLGAYASDRGLTPHLDALARESVVFDATYAPAPFTLPSLSALLTGRYPESLGVWSNEARLATAAPTLAGLLREAGWSTAAVVGNWVLRASAGLDRGFDLYDDALPQSEAARGWPERVAAETTDAALRALDALPSDPGARRFLWVHYQDPHGPYTPPPEHRRRHLERERAAPGGDRELEIGTDQSGRGTLPAYQLVDGRRDVAFYRAGYDGEVSYLDGEIGRLLEELAARGLRADAAIAFAADHGEALGEGDHWFAHGEQLTSELVRVPLFLRLPGVAPARRGDVVSLVDVLPTLLAAVAPEVAGAGGPGRDLLAADADAPARGAYLAALGSAERLRFGWVEGDYRYTLEQRDERDDVWDGRLVRRDRDDLDLTAAAPQIARHMRGRLTRFRQRFEGAPPPTFQELSAADRERLRALGYVREP